VGIYQIICLISSDKLNLNFLNYTDRFSVDTPDAGGNISISFKRKIRILSIYIQIFLLQEFLICVKKQLVKQKLPLGSL